MPDDALKPALRAALRLHEIADKTPYRLFFAGKGKSGASFGFMQGDLAAGQPEVRQTFLNVCAAAGIGAAAAATLVQRLSVPLIVNPLDPAETQQVNDALAASSRLVDAMDEAILQKVYASLDTCLATAGAAHRGIAPKALIYMALWINMTGPPTKLLVWLGGRDPGLHRPVALPDQLVDAPAMEAYLQATDYFVENPGNLPHMLQCAAAGASLLAAPPPVGIAAPAAVPAAALPDTCFAYEQATGNIFEVAGGGRDLIDTGYSGSDQHGGKNNPLAQCVQDIGPLPRGRYTIKPPVAGPSPFSLPLTPAPDNEMCGRSGFLIHGDSIAQPGTASHGCIIVRRPTRQHIADSGIDLLVVVERLG